MHVSIQVEKQVICNFVSIYFAPTTILLVQLNLNLIENVCGIGLTQHIFILHTWKYACVYKINQSYRSELL